RSNAVFAYGYKVEAFSSDLLGTFERNAFTRTCKDAACVYTTTTHAVRECAASYRVILAQAEDEITSGDSYEIRAKSRKDFDHAVSAIYVLLKPANDRKIKLPLAAVSSKNKMASDCADAMGADAQ
ncbi:MAG: hypothetical protein ACYDD1_20085, partial [Caulobacteraceae bacterium]